MFKSNSPHIEKKYLYKNYIKQEDDIYSSRFQTIRLVCNQKHYENINV